MGIGFSLVSAFVSLSLTSGGAPNPGPVRIPDGFTAHAVRGALHGAARRLQQPRCQQVLAEFQDAQGRRLDRNLVARGQTGASYMDTMFFYDAPEASRCQNRLVLAFTRPGDRVVFVCGRAFQDAYRRHPRMAEAVIIHEMLHSLGLGENPPSSTEITARVLRGCRG
jgi:hypothetical protein